MYSARIETDAGKTFRFGYDDGTLFDISPLSGIDVELSTSQGFQQVGETVESQSVAGISRTISGVVLDSATATQMINFLPAFTTGRLYFNNTHYCEIFVQKTPAIVRAKSGKLNFSMMVYCATPYWMQAESSGYTLGEWIPSFRFPVNYSKSHRFGTKNPSAFINVQNLGGAAVPFTLTMTCEATVKNPGIINVHTLEELKINDTLSVGDVVKIYRTNGRLYVEKNGADAFSILDEESKLLWINAGDNVLKMTADSGVDNLVASVEFNAADLGVIYAPD